MEVLKEYPEEYANTFQTSFSFLFKINMKFWFHGEGFLRKYWRFLYILPTVVIFSITMTIDVCKQMREGEIFEVANRLPLCLVILQGVLKALALFPKSTQITNIIKELGTLWKTKELNHKQTEARKQILKRVHIYNKGCYWITIIGTLQYLTSPLLETLFRKFILQQESGLLLPVASSYPFDPTGNWIVYMATYAFQTYSLFLCVIPYAGIDMLMITMCVLLAVEFTLLSEELIHVKPVHKKIKKISNNADETLTIEDFVKKHQTLISLSIEIDDVFNKLIFINLLFVGGTTCSFRYAGQFSRGPSNMLNNYLGMVVSLLPVLFMCYSGELLQGASLRIGEVAYENLWYKGDKNYQRIIFMIIKRSSFSLQSICQKLCSLHFDEPCCRSQNACSLTSMKYAPITLNMFTKVISTTWSYFSLMNSVYEETE